jgi:uncharacterized membrane protein HdeD (DUF308 family)
MEQTNLFKKYKWIYLWIVGAALAVFSIVMLLNKEFGNSIVFYLTGALLIVFVIVRFIPLIKTTRNRWAIVMNSIEMFVDLAVGILMIVLTAKQSESTEETNNFLEVLYPFLIGGVLYARGGVYFAETSFFKTKPEISKFFVSLGLLTVGTVIMARYDNFGVDSMRWLFGIIFTICGVYAIVDGIINYNNYRKLYVKPRVKKEVSDKEEVLDEAEIITPGKEENVIIDEKNDDRPQEYVN